MCMKTVMKVLPIALTVASAVTGNPAFAAVGQGLNTMNQAKQADKAQKTQEKANAAADQNAKAGLAAQEQAMTKVNAKAPNVAALLAQNQNDTALGGPTSLTGPSGVKRSDLQLGKNTLLGS
jgi:hypothetical protein